MTSLKAGLVLLTLAYLAGCGQQTVDYGNDVGSNPSADTGTNHGVDASTLPGADTGASATADTGTSPGADSGMPVAPTVTSTYPVNGAMGAALNTSISATFSKPMDATTLTATTFTVKQGATSVSGGVTYAAASKTATFAPAAALVASVVYTGTITTGAKDPGGLALAQAKTWSFTTGTTVAKGPSPVSLGMAGDYVILAKSKVDTVPTSAVTGDIGVSPAAASYITGFSLIADSTNVFSTSTQVVGKVYAANFAVPTPSNLTTAIGDMQTAYTDAADRPTPDFSELGAGDISGKTLVPGLYKWGTGVSINTNVTLNGGANDVWIFQIAGGLTQANGTHVNLTGGAVPKNIFWQSFGVVTIGTTAHIEGIIMAQTAITLDTGASINGRLLAQTAVTIKTSTVTEPAP